MIRIVFFLLVFVRPFSFPRVYSEGRKQRPLSLKVGFERLWKMAKAKAPTLRLARLKIAGYEAMLRGSKLLYAPTVSLTFQGAPSPKFTCVMPQAWIDSADLGGMSEHEFKEKYCVGTNRDDSITYELDGYALRFQVKAVQPLYTFGKIAYTKAMAKAALSGGYANLKRRRRALKLMVRKAWYGRKSAILISRLLADAEKMMKKAKRRAEKYEDEGTISPIQMIRLKLGENEILRRKLAVTKMDRLTLEALKILTGRAVDVDEGRIKLSYKAPPPLSVLYKSALKGLPELRALKAVRAVKVAKVGLAKAAFYPNLGLFVRYTLKFSNSDDPRSVYANDGLHGNSLAFGVGLEMKIDPARMITDYNLAKIERRQADADIAAAKDLLKLRLTKARQEVIHQIARIRLLRKGVKLSRAWSVALTDHEALGKVKPKEMVDSLTSYFKLKLGLIEARYQLSCAWAALRYASGEKI